MGNDNGDFGNSIDVFKSFYILRMKILRKIQKRINNEEGQAIVETLIVLPLIIIFILIIMEVAMLYNAKQVTNYAAFCAARTASVYGQGDTSRMHKAMAIALIPISPKITSDVQQVINSFLGPLGITTDFFQPFNQIPGSQLFGSLLDYLERYVDAYLRSSVKSITISNKNIEVVIKYYYRCRVFPIGTLLGTSSFSEYIDLLQHIPGFPNLSDFLHMVNYNILLTSSIRMDYWM